MTKIKSITFNGSVNPAWLLIRKIKRPLMPPIEAILESVPGRPGAYDFGTETDVKIYEIEVTMIANTEAERQARGRELATWLQQKELKELRLSDEPGVFYMARLTGSTDLESVVQDQDFTITFVCPDSYANGDPVTVTGSGTPVYIQPQGNIETFPRIKLTVTAATSYIFIRNTTTGKYIQLGKPLPVTSTEKADMTLQIADDLKSKTGWGAGAFVDNGTIAGTMDSNGTDFVATSFGTGTGWHGPALIKSSPKQLQDFDFQARLTLDSDRQSQIGRVEFYLLAADGETVAKVTFEDKNGSIERNEGYIMAGPFTDRKRIIDGERGIYRDLWNAMNNGFVRIRRNGKRWLAYISKVDPANGWHKSARKYYWTDADGKYQKKVASVMIHIGQYGTNPVPVRQSANWFRLYEVNSVGASEQAIIADAGDVIEIDTATGDIRKNGEEFLEPLDLSSDFFSLLPGQANELEIAPGASYEITYNPQYTAT